MIVFLKILRKYYMDELKGHKYNRWLTKNNKKL